jgi:hypothetical protein
MREASRLPSGRLEKTHARALWKCRAEESVENSKSEFPTLSSALGNPAKSAGFPHFHSDDGGYLTPKNIKGKE